MTKPSTDHILEAATRALELWRSNNGHLSRLSFLEQFLFALDKDYAEFAQQEYLRGLEEGYASGFEAASK